MGALTGRDMVCFSNDWGGDPLSKTHLMRLAARDNRVLWVNSVGNRPPRADARDLRRAVGKLAAALGGVREAERNLFVLSPLSIPIYGSRLVNLANGWLLSARVRAAMRTLRMRDPIAWSYLPAAAPAFDRLGAALHVYHCVDEFSAFRGSGTAIAALERELLLKSDVVIAASAPLAQAKRRLHPHVHLVRHGVDHAHFAKSLLPELATSPLVRDLPRPVMGFMGLVAEWVDLQLLAALADRFPGGTLVVAGREDVDTSALRARRNVVFLGRRPYAELPSLLKGFDVALLPFRDDELTRASNPLKVREYLAAGLPVISTPVPEVRRLGLCHIASGAAEFAAAVDAVMATRPGPFAERSDAVRGESWEARWEEISAIVAGAMHRPAAWQKRSA